MTALNYAQSILAQSSIHRALHFKNGHSLNQAKFGKCRTCFHVAFAGIVNFLTRAEIFRGIWDSVTMFPSIGILFYPKMHKYLMKNETYGISIFN